ncbi:MAG: glycosyl hydrolase-related protein [Planctomycetota bacterium]|nr:glycosyl hydrolase-related protein [Planctomycetota bacterium]
MKQVLVFCDNHMDVIWRRGCRGHYRSVDGIIRPYSDIEEEQIRRAVRWASTSDYRYTFEQSLPLKLFLERNPDLLPLVKQMVAAGKIELPGGGETLIDLNMVCGESLVRNHLYSILWCERTFGTRSHVACGTDLFGYSAQMPQILNQFDYRTMANTSRVFDDGTPFWRGLDGSILLVRPTWENLGFPQVFAPGGCTHSPPLCCGGEGCPACGFRGMDISNENVRDEETRRRLFDRILAIETGPIVLRITGEENLENTAALTELLEHGRRAGLDLRFVTMTELVEAIDGERLARLRAGQLRNGEVFPGPESATVCTGCYVSRIQLKLWNRRLEEILLAAESFAAFAAPLGMIYPRRKLESLWNQMALVQFHDAITGSHSDGAYEELLGVCRNIARGAWQIYEEGTHALAGHVAANATAGRRTAVVFNPLPWPVEGAPVDVVLDVPQGETALDVEVADAGGRRVAVTGVVPVRNAVGGKLNVRLTGLHLPPLGYGAIQYRFTNTPPVIQPIVGNALENEYYRVVLDAQGVAEIIDKETGETILRQGAGGLQFEEDYGSPWETLAKPSFSCSVAQFSSPTRTLSGNGDVQTAVFEGEFNDRRIQHERQIGKITWRQEITVYAGVKRVHFKMTVNWDTHNGRLMLVFPLAFRTPNDEATYEIPFGVLPRKRYEGDFGIHTRPNGDWPALNFVACRNADKDLWVTVANKGTPCHRLADGVLRMTVLRSPCISMAAWDIEGAREVGSHVFEAVVSSGTGELRTVNPVRLGREFNAPFIAVSANSARTPSLPPAHSFLTHENQAVAISAVKRAEDGDDLVVRLHEPYGVAAKDQVTGIAPDRVRAADLLERASEAAADLHFRPYEIKTVRIRSDA